MDNQNFVYTHNGVSFNLQKEGNSDIYYNMYKPWRQYAKWNKPDTKGQILYESPLHNVPRAVKFTEAK